LAILVWLWSQLSSICPSGWQHVCTDFFYSFTSQASVEVLLKNFKNWLQTEENRKQKTENRQTHSGVYRVAPATKNWLLQQCWQSQFPGTALSQTCTFLCIVHKRSLKKTKCPQKCLIPKYILYTKRHKFTKFCLIWERFVR
jgi:hypothetical protein